jgi:hypothetical protein
MFFQSEKNIPHKPVISNNSWLPGNLKTSDNGVTQLNDGHVLIKVGSYSDSSIMKYINSMGCSLSEKLSFIKEFEGSDKIQNIKTVNSGYYIKGGIEALKGSGIFLLASGGVESDSAADSTKNQMHAPGVFVGGGIGYFLKNITMQVGYDNKVGASASFGIIW